MHKKNFFLKILKTCQIKKLQHQTAGFTLLEVLVVTLVGGLLITGLLYFVVQLLESDRKEFAQAETQREMAIAMDYIATDLKEAVYVYEGECFIGKTDKCPGLFPPSTSLPGGANTTPILAFWKLEQVPYPGGTDLPNTCPTAPAKLEECNNLKLTGNTYTLVVYFLRQNTKAEDDGQTWQGPARITRYQLRKYENLSSLALENGYINPIGDNSDNKKMSFTTWPCPAAEPNCSATRPSYTKQDVLVDLVDFNVLPGFKDLNSLASGTQPCPANYKATPPDIFTLSGTVENANPSSNSSFYACVRPWDVGMGQDVIVFLRGNALKRAGIAEGPNRQAGSLPTTYLPAVQTQVQTRSAFERTPGELR